MQIKKISKIIFTHLACWLAFSILIYINSFFFNSNFKLKYFFAELIISISVFYINYLFLIPEIVFKAKKIKLFIGVELFFLLFFVVGNIYLEKFQINQNVPIFLFAVFSLILSYAIKITEKYYENKKEQDNNQFNIKLSLLRNQINPHFFFNSLNSIYGLTQKKSDLAPKALLLLSEIVRYVLSSSNEEITNLSNEIENLEKYIQINKLRFSNQIKIEYQKKGNFSFYLIEPLLLMTFIENAFKHGDFSTHPIKIQIFENKGQLQFYVKNAIARLERTQKNIENTGLKTTKKRLKYLYPQKYYLNINNSSQFYEVHLTLKLKKNELPDNR